MKNRYNVINMKKLRAFTLAEVLITLAIIGVVAALTIPTVVTNYRKKMYVTQLKKSYSSFNSAFKTMMAKEGVTRMTDTTLWSKFPSGYTYVFAQNMNGDFFQEFKKHFNIYKAYDAGQLPEPYATKFLNGESASGISNGILLSDGTWLWYMFNKNAHTVDCPTASNTCRTLKEFQQYKNTLTKLWDYVGVMLIDVNGLKEPNTYGRDVFWFFLGNDGMLYPYGGADHAVLGASCDYHDLANCASYWANDSSSMACNASGKGQGCAGRVMEAGWKMDY